MKFPPLYPLIILFIFPLIGGLIAFYTNKEWKRVIRLFLSFSGAFLFSITLLNFIPEVYHHIPTQAGYWVLGGFFFQIILERFTHGIEHGHSHISAIRNIWPIFLGLGLHAFLEGIPLGAYGRYGDEALNSGLLYGIALHEMPAAFVLAISLRAIMPQTKLIFWIFAYALFCPTGAILGFYVESADHGNDIFQILLAFVAGTFLHISTTILFENSDNHKFPTHKLLAIIIGAGLALLTQLL